MKRIYFKFLLAPVMVALFFAGTNYSGGSPGGKTGSPGDNNATCTQCHSGTAVPAEGWISSDIPELGYVVGDTYTITATATHSGSTKIGFELTAEDPSGNKVGTFAIIEAGTQLANGGHSVTHTSSGTAAIGGTRTWSVQWTAPSSDVGIVTFYGAFNATNSNGSTSGDVIYTSTMSMDESSVGLGNQPAIAEFSFGPNPSFGSVQVNHPYESAEVSVYDISGKRVYEQANYYTGNTIDLNNLHAGVYFIQLTHGDAVKSQKLIIK